MGKRSKGKQPRFVQLYHWFMATEAWRDLDCVARCAYVELGRRYAGLGSNNGEIHCSVLEMAGALGTSKATALRALDRLQDHGFIVLMKRGAFSVKNRQASEWRLTEFKCDVTGDLATKDFVRWQKQNTVSNEHPNGCRDETERVSR
jgi:DNA-binding transcriptional regulator YhcF (GntR family)